MTLPQIAAQPSLPVSALAAAPPPGTPAGKGGSRGASPGGIFAGKSDNALQKNSGSSTPAKASSFLSAPSGSLLRATSGSVLQAKDGNSSPAQITPGASFAELIARAIAGATPDGAASSSANSTLTKGVPAPASNGTATPNSAVQPAIATGVSVKAAVQAVQKVTQSDGVSSPAPAVNKARNVLAQLLAVGSGPVPGSYPSMGSVVSQQVPASGNGTESDAPASGAGSPDIAVEGAEKPGAPAVVLSQALSVSQGPSGQTSGTGVEEYPHEDRQATPERAPQKSAATNLATIPLSGGAIPAVASGQATITSDVPKTTAEVKPAGSSDTFDKSDGSGAASKPNTAARDVRKAAPKLSPLQAGAAALVQSVPLPLSLAVQPAVIATTNGANPPKTMNEAPMAAVSRSTPAPLAGGAPPLTADLPATQAEHIAFALAASATQGSNGATAQGSAQPSMQMQASADSETAKNAVRPAPPATPAVVPAAQQAIAAPLWQAAAAGIGPPSASQRHGGPGPQASAALPEAHEIAKPVAQDALRTLRVQFVGDNNQRVDVRLGDASGQLRVSVRSTDALLTQTLQDRMPELTARLGDQHFHTEVWIPPAGGPAETSGTGNAAIGGRSAGNFFAGGNPGGQGQPGGRQQGGQNQYRPAWIDDFGANPRRAQTARRS